MVHMHMTVAMATVTASIMTGGIDMASRRQPMGSEAVVLDAAGGAAIEFAGDDMETPAGLGC